MAEDYLHTPYSILMANINAMNYAYVQSLLTPLFIYDKIYIPDCIAHTIIMFHVYRVDDGKCNMDIMYMDMDIYMMIVGLSLL